ncbi:hypothetical protein AFLA_013287 [Aspergillus flavus NRRL3357]|nr:hypothetical protein AFLA_013287 [Aspergillus flavus NRRL3357]
MAFPLSPVEIEDVDALVRNVEYPAHLHGPLRRLMLAHSAEQQWKYREDEIRWVTEGIYQALDLQDEILYKACGADGQPVGIIGWTTSSHPFSKGMKYGEQCIQEGPIIKCEERQGRRTRHHNSWTPPSLDVSSWRNVSKMLRKERQRVLQGWKGNGIYRIVFMAVAPHHQRQGVGSTLLKMLCDYVDEYELDIFIISSPDGIRVYSKF